MAASRLRVLLVGASGTLGRAVAAELGQRHDIISAGRESGDVRMDLRRAPSIQRGLSQAGALDAVVCVAGNVAFAPLAEFEATDLGDSLHALGITDKLLGQVNLTLAARDVLHDGGSITLIAGSLSEQPVVQGSSASLVNGAIESFVRAVAIELPRGLRINAVSPCVLTESLEAYGSYFRGVESVPAARAALACCRSVEGAQTGQVYKVV